VRKQIFLSYNKRDVEEAKKIVDCIEERGIGCWFQLNDSRGDFAEKIAEGLANSSVFVVLLSDDSMSSIYVCNEINTAISRRNEDPDYKIVPVMLKEMKPMYSLKARALLATFNWIKAANYKDTNQLVKAIFDDAELGSFIEGEDSRYSAESFSEKTRLAKQDELIANRNKKTLDAIFENEIGLVLDVGCSDGTLITKFLDGRNYGHLLGVDHNEDVVEKANSEHSDNGRNYYLSCDIESDDFELLLKGYLIENEAEGFDLVTVSFVLLHLKHPERVLSAIRKCMRKGGKILINEVDDATSVAHPWDDFFADAFYVWRYSNESGDRFMARKIPGLLKRCGFENVDIVSTAATTADEGGRFAKLLWDIFFNVNYWSASSENDYVRPDAYERYLECKKAYRQYEEKFNDGEIFLTLGFWIITGEV